MAAAKPAAGRKPAAKKPATPRKPKASTLEPLDLARAAAAVTAGASAYALLSVNGDTVEGIVYTDDPQTAPARCTTYANERGGLPVLAHVTYPTVRIDHLSAGTHDEVTIPPGAFVPTD